MTAPLVIVATGSSAVLVLPHYLTKITARVGGDLTVVLSSSALRFLSPEAVGWFAETVIEPDAQNVNPVELAIRARGVVVLPATGNVVATAALGLMPTTATTVIGVSPKPCLFFPQMHAVVWRKPTTQAHIATLRADGHKVVDPEMSMGYEISRREVVEGLSMPSPQRAAEIVEAWLDEIGP